jgi:MFS family permease
MDKAARTRQRILALFLPIAAVLYISAEALSPKGTDQVATDTATALKLLAIAAQHPTQLYVAGTFAVLGLGALAVSYAAIAALARNRGSALATVAALIGGIGAFCGAITNVFVFPNLAAAATAHTTRGAAAQFLVTTFNSGFGHVFLYVYFIGIYVAPLLMGVALWRSRSVPRWLAVLFFAGLEVAQQQISSGPVVILYMLPFAAAMILLAAKIWQAATLPASQPQQELTSIRPQQ